jgi:hypothetical protein
MDKENVSCIPSRNIAPSSEARGKKAESQQAPAISRLLSSAPLLLCQSKPQDPLIIGFGSIDCLQQSIKYVNVFNPSRVSSVRVKITETSGGIGLSVAFEEGARDSVIEPMSAALLHICWNPVQKTSLEGEVLLHMDGNIQLRIRVNGIAVKEQEVRYISIKLLFLSTSNRMSLKFY